MMALGVMIGGDEGLDEVGFVPSLIGGSLVSSDFMVFLAGGYACGVLPGVEVAAEELDLGGFVDLGLDGLS
jgi:hypothetical protein